VATVRLSAAFWRYDRTQALLDGRVKPEGVELDCQVLRPEEAFALAFAAAPFDVTEISLSNTLTAVSQGEFPYWLIPVFPSRAFRHGALFVRTDRGIEGPADLAGKRVGLQEYDMTAAVVLRGTLRDAYGLDTYSIRWCVGEAERSKPLEFPLARRPPGLQMEILPPGLSLEARLLAGELDAVVSLREPHAVRAGDGRVRRLFARPEEAERAWFVETGLFPIMHAVGVRKTLVNAHPGLPLAVYRAFCESKDLAVAELEVIQAPKITLPWINAELRRTRELMGEDFWPSGIAANRRVLETQMRWSREDGLQARTVSIEDLFAPGLLDT
jgi:4,5-dihydroxyphthalate decarboxylase